MLLKLLISVVIGTFVSFFGVFTKKLIIALKTKTGKYKKLIFLTSLFLLLLVGTIISGALLKKKTMISYNRITVTKIEDFHDRYVLFLDDGNVVIKEELKWRNTDNIYYKVARNYYGDQEVTLVVRRNK